MIKKFLISFLGSMAAIWITFVLLFLLVISLIVAGIGSMGSTRNMVRAEVTKGSVLVLNLDEEIVEREEAISLRDALYGQITKTQNLNEIVSAIYRAAHDSRIIGIYADCGGASGGTASLQAIEEALAYFKSQPNKWVMAYADNYGQPDYYMTSGANEIWLNPQGAVDLHGLSATTLFYTGLLDKLGVKMQIVRVGTFKSAVEPFMLKEMSPASRMQQEVYMNSIWSSLNNQMAKNRGVSETIVNRWADEFTFSWPADSILKSGIVTKLGYRHEAEEHIAELAGKESFDDVNKLTVNEYVTTYDLADFSFFPDVKFNKKSKTIAVLYAVGEIVDNGETGIVGDKMVEQILELADDSEDLAGLILRVNSPGGSAFASEQIWEALKQFKERTRLPFYVSMGDVAASGGYYISCGADVIYAQPTTITGSIGIFGMIPDFQGLLNNHLGITTATVQTNRNGSFPNLFGPMTPEQADKMQKYVERGYDTFTKRCAEGRQMSQDSIKAIAEGRVWDGALAQKIGLVDRMGSLHTAIKGMASDLKIDSYRVEEFPKVNPQWWQSLMTMDGIQEAGLNMTPEKFEAMRLSLYIDHIKKAPRIQCRMEDIEIK